MEEKREAIATPEGAEGVEHEGLDQGRSDVVVNEEENREPKVNSAKKEQGKEKGDRHKEDKKHHHHHKEKEWEKTKKGEKKKPWGKGDGCKCPGKLERKLEKIEWKIEALQEKKLIILGKLKEAQDKKHESGVGPSQVTPSAADAE